MENKDELLIALLNKIDVVLNGSDNTVNTPSDNYIAWCQPGIPFQKEDLQFGIKGITGKDADETRNLIRNAAEFSNSVNLIPTSNTMENGIFNQNGAKVSEVYENVLKYSQVANSELTDSEKEKITKFRKLFVVTKKKKDIITDEEIEVTEDSPVIKAYNSAKALYNEAVLEYNSKRLAALNGDDRASVQDFTLNANLYRSKVRQALGNWETNGYKLDVEKILAYNQQVSQRSLTLLKDDLLDKLAKAKLSDPNSGSDFYLSSFYPANFINDDKGWTKITFSNKHKETYSKDTTSTTSYEAKANYGLWSANVSGKSAKKTNHGTMKSENFYIEFSIAQVSIGRPWMSPEFLKNTAWRWKEGLGQDLLSNGKNPAKGQMTAYPTTAVFVKDVKITSENLSTYLNSVEKS